MLRPATRSRSQQLLLRRLRLRLLALMVLAAVGLAGCGGSEIAAPQRQPMKVQALSVHGEMLVVDDLAEVDTMLWFWAPW